MLLKVGLGGAWTSCLVSPFSAPLESRVKQGWHTMGVGLVSRMLGHSLLVRMLMRMLDMAAAEELQTELRQLKSPNIADVHSYR